jgi:hypothetical protein
MSNNVIRDIEGRYLSNDVVDAIYAFLRQKLMSHYTTVSDYCDITITMFHFTNGFYKIEFTEVNKAEPRYLEIPESWVLSYIREKKINSIIE